VSAQPGKRPPSYLAAYLTLAVALVAAILFVIIFGAVKAFTASDRYGTVPVPGEETLNLPEGDVTVYFQEAVHLGENQTLDPPRDLRLEIRGAGGGPPVELDRGGASSEIGGGFGERVSIGDVDVPAGGDYTVAVARTAENRADPAIVLGDDLFEGFFAALRPAVLVLVGGGIVAAIVAAATYGRRRRFRESGLAQ